MKRASLILVALAACLPAPAPAQNRDFEDLDLPRAVADEIVALFGDDETVRFDGRSTVPRGSVIAGNVAVLGGPLEVAGDIEGDVVVLNGDLVFERGGRVRGDVLVVGGRVRRRTIGRVDGTLTIYSEPVGVVERSGGVELRGRRRRRSTPYRYGGGRAWISLRTGANYNRVEGMPVMFGPAFETADPASLRGEALAVWRTDSGFTFDEEEMGYRLLLAQRFGRDRRVGFGGTVHSIIDPIEEGGLTDIESSLATFLFHRDYRDYFERTGWSAFATAGIPGTPLDLRVEYRDEEHTFAPVGDPWTVRRNDDAWRPQPLVAQGEVRSVLGELRVDSRNDRVNPSDGWLLVLRGQRGLEGDFQIPTHHVAPGAPVVPARPVDPEFSTGSVDVRRYGRLGPDAAVALRAFAAGSLDGDPLPPQFQHALGGEGTLPGYRLLSQDCGARASPATVVRTVDEATVEEPVFTSYGCDRVALFQLEYRGDLRFEVDWGDDDWGSWSSYSPLELSPSWALMFNAGRGWSRSDPAVDTGWLADVGAGLFIGDFGVYVAVPLDGESHAPNLFVRLNRRF